MFTTAYRDTCLTNIGAFIGLLTAITSWRAGTVTETNYTGYSATRPGASWGSIGDMSPAYGRQKSNGSAVTFGQNTGGSTVNMMAFGVYSAASAGTLHAIGLLDTDVPFFGTVDAADAASGELITVPNHALSTDQRVFVLGAPGAPIPGGLSENTDYWVRSGSTTDQYTLATSQGGAAVNITSAGSALFCPHTLVPVANLATPEFAIGALIVQI